MFVLLGIFVLGGFKLFWMQEIYCNSWKSFFMAFIGKKNQIVFQHCTTWEHMGLFLVTPIILASGYFQTDDNDTTDIEEDEESGSGPKRPKLDDRQVRRRCFK